MDVEDETTPLLALPGIAATAETLSIPKVSSDRAAQTQFSLLVLLYARKNVKETATGTPWEVMQQTKKRQKMAERTESECMAIWSEFCEEEEDVESVLFGEMDGMRVVDLLDAAPDALLDDELLYATMASATYGLLLSYVMHPPDRPMIYATSGEYMGGREWALLVLSLSTGSVLVLAAFVLATPPFPEDASFGLLLVAVFVYTFQLQPVPALPLFVGLRRRVAETVFPVVALFLPALLLTCFLLSASLNDVFLTAAVPMETRSLLLFLLFAIILAVFFSIILAPSPVHFGNDKWKRYGPAVCREARLTYYRTVVAYSNPCYYPPPFNLLDLVLFRSLSFLGIPIQSARTLFWRLTVGVIAYIINRLIMATSHIAQFLFGWPAHMRASFILLFVVFYTMALPLPDDKTDDKPDDKPDGKPANDTSKADTTNDTSKTDTTSTTTIQSALTPMLLQIDPKAPDRFVTASPIGPTTFGTADQIQSNYALAHIADRPFAETKYSTWGAAYTAFLLETGTDDLPSFAAQNSLIVRYYNILGRLAVYQTKLMKAYQDDVGGETTNIGVSADAGVPPADPVSLRKMEEWGRGEIVKAELEGCEDDLVFTKTDWNAYLRLNRTLAQIQPDYDDQTLANLIASQAYVDERLLYSYPGMVNRTMVVSGDQGSPQASYVPAWTATILNATSVNGASAKEITGNFENAARREEKDPSADSAATKSADTNTTTTQSADSTGGCKPKKKRSPQQKISSVFRAVAAAASSSSSSSPVRINGHGIVSHQVASSSSSTTLSSPLTSSSNLILVSLQEGTWADKRAEFIEYAWEEQPEIAEVYLGRRGEGPIGRRWSHVVLLAEGEGDVETIWLLGMVWEALPGPEGDASF
ncbi:hypothetical protein EV421DRAFT_1895497 [Armillaria borealis]|uniref:Uncharacterized protein n=1 Tax=Armillaria borealis TaxID=47425 RepID=A0AA39KAH8_9AGAR|nr:hypothetical protein EV421DRAFT_1895497 [Armillaria borealis]